MTVYCVLRDVRQLNTLYSKAGKKVSVSNIDPKIPHNTIIPTPRYNSVPSPGINTNGARPRMVVAVDIKMGRKRVCTAARMASTNSVVLLSPFEVSPREDANKSPM